MFINLIINNAHNLSYFCLQWICIPFAITHKAVGHLSAEIDDFVGNVKSDDIGIWFDYAMLLIFGGIPWQVYFQRVLSCKSAKSAQTISYIAAFGCFLMAIPSILIGGIAKMAGLSNIFFYPY